MSGIRKNDDLDRVVTKHGIELSDHQYGFIRDEIEKMPHNDEGIHFLCVLGPALGEVFARFKDEYEDLLINGDTGKYDD